MTAGSNGLKCVPVVAIPAPRLGFLHSKCKIILAPEGTSHGPNAVSPLMRGSLARTAGVVCLLAAAAVGAGAGALAAEGSGTPGPGAATRDRDALWLGHAWVDGRRTPADAGRLAAGLRDTGIHDLYLHVGPLDDRGNLDPALRPRAVPLVRAIKGALPDARV